MAALVLRHLHGYSNREIGAALGVPESTIATRLADARRTLRARLERSMRAHDTAEPSAIPDRPESRDISSDQ